MKSTGSWSAAPMVLKGSLFATPMAPAGQMYNAQQPNRCVYQVEGTGNVLSGGLLRLESKKLLERLEQQETFFRRDARNAQRTRMCGLRAVGLRYPTLGLEDLKSRSWRGKITKSFGKGVLGSWLQPLSLVEVAAITGVSSSGNNGRQQSMSQETVSRRAWLLSSAALALVTCPSEAHGVTRLYDLGAFSSTATDSVQKEVEDVKSWYRYRGEGFILRIPPGYEDILDPIDEDPSSTLYGERVKERPFAARFASPDRDEVLSIVVKPASQLRLSFFETKDISDFGSIKDAAENFVPVGAKLVSARIINSKSSRLPRTYYNYEFLVRDMHFTLSAGVSRGRVFVLGASAPQKKWKDSCGRLQLAASTFYLP